MPRWKRPHANHELRADDCRRHPGVWIEIGPYSSGYSGGIHLTHVDPMPATGRCPKGHTFEDCTCGGTR